MSDFKERLFEEYDELTDRIKALQDFSCSQDFERMDTKQKGLIKDQLFVMDRYLNILSLRIDFENDIEESENKEREYQRMCEEKEPINYAGSMAGY